MRMELERLDELIVEAQAVAEVLLFVEEEADAPALARLQAAIVALLYLALERLRQALTHSSRIARKCEACRRSAQA